MPRLPRIVLEGVPHHIVQRGNNRGDVFFSDDDRRRYLWLLRQQSKTHGLEIVAYCLMVNHVHLVAVPTKPDSLARAVGRTHFAYTQHVNRVHERSGHLWQNRFYSCALDEGHFWAALRYVEQNPLRAGLAQSAETYEWSSAYAHVSGNDPRGILDMAKWSAIMNPEGWREVIARPVGTADLLGIRQCTNRGWPLADDDALAKYEKTLGRSMRPRPVGRPAS